MTDGRVELPFPDPAQTVWAPVDANHDDVIRVARAVQRLYDVRAVGRNPSPRPRGRSARCPHIRRSHRPKPDSRSRAFVDARSPVTSRTTPLRSPYLSVSLICNAPRVTLPETKPVCRREWGCQVDMAPFSVCMGVYGWVRLRDGDGEWSVSVGSGHGWRFSFSWFGWCGAVETRDFAITMKLDLERFRTRTIY